MGAREDVIAEVSLLADTSSTPALTAAEVEAVVDRCAVADANLVPPSDAAWVPTFWVERAVQLCFELRAAKASVLVDVEADQTNVFSSQLGVALSREAARWRVRCAGSVVGW